jgi:hypothetical protein
VTVFTRGAFSPLGTGHRAALSVNDWSMRRVVLGLVLLLAMGDSCNNGVVGVQDYGIVSGRVLDATTNQPIPNAIISVGSLFTGTADATGAFTLPHIPVGLQSVTARMPGYTTDSQQVRVKKDLASSIGYLRLVPFTANGRPTLPPPATPTPVPTTVATWTPPSPSPSASSAVSAAPVTPVSPSPSPK